MALRGRRAEDLRGWGAGGNQPQLIGFAREAACCWQENRPYGCADKTLCLEAAGSLGRNQRHVLRFGGNDGGGDAAELFQFAGCSGLELADARVWRRARFSRHNEAKITRGVRHRGLPTRTAGVKLTSSERGSREHSGGAGGRWESGVTAPARRCRRGVAPIRGGRRGTSPDVRRGERDLLRAALRARTGRSSAYCSCSVIFYSRAWSRARSTERVPWFVCLRGCLPSLPPGLRVGCILRFAARLMSETPFSGSGRREFEFSRARPRFVGDFGGSCFPVSHSRALASRVMAPITPRTFRGARALGLGKSGATDKPRLRYRFPGGAFEEVDGAVAVMTASQLPDCARSKALGLRHSCRKTSCRTSSAAPVSPSTRTRPHTPRRVAVIELRHAPVAGQARTGQIREMPVVADSSNAAFI